MKSVGQRIRTLRESAGLTQKELATKVQHERATVASWETDRRVPEPTTLGRLADAFGVSVDFLLGRIPQNREENPAYQRPLSLPLVRMQKGAHDMIAVAHQILPILGLIKAGIPLLSEEHIIGHIEVPEHIARQADFALEVSGDSMIGTGLQPGDYVFMRVASKRPPSHGDIVAAMVDGEMTLKRYVKRNGGSWVLHAENPAYQDIPVDQRVIIQGVYAGRFSEYAGMVDPPSDELTDDELITKIARRKGLDPDMVAGMLEVLNKGRK